MRTSNRTAARRITCALAGSIVWAIASPVLAQSFTVEDDGPGGGEGTEIRQKDGDMIVVIGGGAGTGTPDPDDDIDALSQDQDDEGDDIVFCFSVDADADGVLLFTPGINVPHQSMRNQEAGDAFITTEGWNLPAGLIPPPVSLGEFDNVLVVNQGRGWGDDTGFGLIPDIPPLQFFNPPNRPIDNLDGLAELEPGPFGPPEAYFTLRNGSPSLLTLPGPPNLNRGADIFFDPDITNGDNEQLYAATPQLLLQAGDDIDAVAVIDGENRVQFNPATDLVLFTLAPGSPTLDQFNLSPSDVLIRDQNGLALFARFNEIGVGFDDNLNALHLERIIKDSVEATIRSKIPPGPAFVMPEP